MMAPILYMGCGLYNVFVLLLLLNWTGVPNMQMIERWTCWECLCEGLRDAHIFRVNQLLSMQVIQCVVMACELRSMPRTTYKPNQLMINFYIRITRCEIFAKVVRGQAINMNSLSHSLSIALFYLRFLFVCLPVFLMCKRILSLFNFFFRRRLLLSSL